MTDSTVDPSEANDRMDLRPPTAPPSAGRPPLTRPVDGIVCFGGEDWWYHNRGHYDMRMMRAFAGDVPVLYVNSLGMRVPRPSEGKMFGRRVVRKLRSLGRGLHRVDDGFAVLSAPSVPGRAGAALRPLTLRAIHRAMAELGLHRPLAWVACPTAAPLLDGLPHEGLVYQRTDRFEAFLDVDAAAISAHDLHLKDRADLVLYCSGAFMDDDADGRSNAVLVDHGVDAERFIAADAEARPPADVAAIAGPRVGFVGAIDPHTFDAPLFAEVARRLPNAQFVLVGGCTLPEGWCPRPNVHLLGQRTPDEVAAYMAACDVLIMPWQQSPWIDACHPVKLKEYLATGRPIVTTPFRELSRYPGLVATATDAGGFAGMIERALEIEFDAIPGRERVAGQSWTERAGTVRTHLRERGIEFLVAPAGMDTTDRLARHARIAGLVAARATPLVPHTDAVFAGGLVEDKPSAADARDDHPTPGAAPGTAPAVSPTHALSAFVGAPSTMPATEPAGDDAALAVALANEDAATTGEDADIDDSPVRLVLHAATPAHAQELPAGELPIACAIVLAGGLRPSPLQEVLDRSPVDWWVTPDASVLDVWADRIRLATAGMANPLPIRVVSTGAVPGPWPTTIPATTIERDPHAFRGPAGVIHDVARHLPPDRHVIVVEAARHLDASLTPMIADHLSSTAAVTVGRNPDGSPAGIYCIRRDALDTVPIAGYCDLKEQWLPRVREAGGLVLVHTLDGRGSMPLRTRTDLIEAARVARQPASFSGAMGAMGAMMPGPNALRVVCRGAMVGPEANVLDSIVMPGAYVGAGTTVIRSIIGPETVIPPDTRIVDGVHHAGRILDEGPGVFRAA
jgi:glycosyltransferase involved in cell wall biosynthesis